MMLSSSLYVRAASYVGGRLSFALELVRIVEGCGVSESFSTPAAG